MSPAQPCTLTETSSQPPAETAPNHGSSRRRWLRLAATGLLLALVAGARAQVSVSAAVGSVSAPGEAQLIVPGNQANNSVYEVFLTPTITGSAARLFGVQSGTSTCTGTIAGGGICAVYVLFAPTFGTAGETFSATLNVPFTLCQTPIANGVPTGSPNCQESGDVFSIIGTVTGSTSAPTVAQIQITPTQPVLLQPGNYGSELAKDNNGGLLASINNTVVQFSAQQAYTPNATPTVIAGNGGSGGTGDGQPALQAGIDPYGIADIGGTVYVVDTGQGVVRDFYAGGQMNLFLGQYGLSCVMLAQTYHIGSEYGGGCYSAVTPPGTELAGPSTLATDGVNLYVNDILSETVRMYSPLSNTTTTLAGYAGQPYFFQGYSTVNIYPGYSGDGALGSAAQLNMYTGTYPAGMAVDASSNLYIADVNNNVIRKVDISNDISTYLGHGPGVSGSYPVGLGNGAAAQATLSNPVALTFDQTGNLYIFDQGGYALREVQVTNGNPVSINTLYSIPYSGLPPVPIDSGTPVIDTTGEILFSSAYYLQLGTYSFPTPTPGIYELLGSGLLTFPAVEIGTPESLTATIANPGTAALEILGTSISGTNAADFKISPTSTCGSSVASGASCTVIVTYNPTEEYTALTRTATLYLSTNVGSGNQVIALTGSTYTDLTLTKAGTTNTPYYNWPETSTPVAYVTAAGGVPPYTFTDNISSASGDWYLLGGTTTASIDGAPLVVGSIPYSITVTDSLGTQATYSNTINSQAASSDVYFTAGQVDGPTGTTATVYGSVNPGEQLQPGAVLPSGFMLIQQDTGPYITYPLTAGAIQPQTFNFDILYHTLTATYTGDGMFYAGTNSPQTLTFNGNHAQSITFNGGGLSAPVGSLVALTAYASSGLPVTYAVLSGPGVIDYSGTNLVLYNTGTVVVRATQAGNSSFAPATPVKASFIGY